MDIHNLKETIKAELPEYENSGSIDVQELIAQTATGVIDLLNHHLETAIKNTLQYTDDEKEPELKVSFGVSSKFTQDPAKLLVKMANSFAIKDSVESSFYNDTIQAKIDFNKGGYEG